MAISDVADGTDSGRSCCVLIAIKERSRCKARLSGRLVPAARLELVRSMLAAVLAAAGSARTVRRVVVVSGERDTVPGDVSVLVDDGEGLNIALTQAHRTLLGTGCREVLILPADLPRISAEDVDQMVLAARGSGLAIAPDAADVGTNALCLPAGNSFEFQFGPDSKRLHVQEAARAGLKARIVRRPGLAFDVDTPADLDLIREQRWLSRLRA